MGFIVHQGIVTLILGLLKWISLYVNSANENRFWIFIAYLFYLSIASWLFTFGYFIKSFDDAVWIREMSCRDDRIGELKDELCNVRNILKTEVSKLEKEKERFFSLVEKMVDGAGIHIEVKKGGFAIDNSDRAVIEKERATISNFV